MTTRASEVIDLTDALGLADAATSRWRAKFHYDDLNQAARIAVWRRYDRGERRRSVLHRVAWAAGVDELRHLTGRRPESRARRRTLSIDHAAWIEPTGDHLDPLQPSQLYGLTGRHAVLADALAAGELRQDVAARLHVHPSRVSQLLAELRNSIEIINRPGGHP